MTLDEFMAAADKSDLYHIGANDGFLMVVHPDEYKGALEEANAKAKENMLKQVKENIGILKAAVNATRLFADSKMMIQWIAAKDIKTSNEAKEVAEKRLLSAANRMIEFAPIENREVKEVYERIGEGFAVIIEGTEHGAYWDRKEWDDKHRK